MLVRQWVATILLLVWVKLMDPLQSVFQDFFLLVKMIALMIGEYMQCSQLDTALTTRST